MLCSDCVTRFENKLFSKPVRAAKYEGRALQRNGANFPFVSFYCFDHAVEKTTAK